MFKLPDIILFVDLGRSSTSETEFDKVKLFDFQSVYQGYEFYGLAVSNIIKSKSFTL